MPKPKRSKSPKSKLFPETRRGGGDGLHLLAFINAMDIKHRLTFRLLSLVIALMLCSQAMAQTPKERSRYFCGKGEVVSIAADAMSIVIRHERIEGFMEAMTMRFKAEDGDVIEGLKPGDRVRFTLRDTPALTRLVFIEKIAPDT